VLWAGLAAVACSSASQSTAPSTVTGTGNASSIPSSTVTNTSTTAGAGTSSNGETAAAGNFSTADGGSTTGTTTVVATGGTGSGATGTIAAGGNTTTSTTATGGTTSAATTTSTSACGATPTTEFYISPTGLDTNPGTQLCPLKTLSWAMTRAPQGGTIWVMPGTYAMTATVTTPKAGLAGNPTKVWAQSTRPVFDWTGQAVADANKGIVISLNYWHLRGLELSYAGDNCILIYGSYNTVEDVIVHHCHDSGIQITVPSSYAGNAAFGADNTISNCDSHHNADATGENADGFSAKLAIGAGNVFRGCRSWNNSDDGFDLFAANDVVTIDHCWAFLNGIPSTSNGDGNGFKLGGAASSGAVDEGGAAHIVTNTASFENRAYGYTRNNNTSTPSLSTCQVHSNGSGDYQSLSCSPSTTMTTTGAAASTIARNADGSLPAIP
jgi:hypothetical protein